MVSALQAFGFSPDFYPDLRSRTRFSLGYHIAGFQPGQGESSRHEITAASGSAGSFCGMENQDGQNLLLKVEASLVF